MPFLCFREWVMSCDFCDVKTQEFCAISVLQLVSDDLWLLWSEDSWILSHFCASEGKWFPVLLWSNDSWILSHFCSSESEWCPVIAVILKLKDWFYAISVFQRVSDILWLLWFQDSWILSHSCSSACEWCPVIAVILRLMDSASFLFFSLWVISVITVIWRLMDSMLFLFFRKCVMFCDCCESKTHEFCAIFCSSGSEWCPVIAVNPRLMDSVPFLFFSLWVMSCDYCDSKTHGFCPISVLQRVSDVLWLLCFKDSWILCCFYSSGSEWFPVIAMIWRLMDSMPFLFFRK